MVIRPPGDDDVLTPGTLVHEHVRRGGRATVRTVLAGEPDSRAYAGERNKLASFPTVREATRERRADRGACVDVGVGPVRLPAVDEQYATARDGVALREQVKPLLDEIDEMLLPGQPLGHPDQRIFADALVPRIAEHRAVRSCAEELYASYAESGGPWQGAARHVRARPRALIVKLRAVARYSTPTRLLGVSRRGRLPGSPLLVVLTRSGLERGERVSHPLGRLRVPS